MPYPRVDVHHAAIQLADELEESVVSVDRFKSEAH